MIWRRHSARPSDVPPPPANDLESELGVHFDSSLAALGFQRFAGRRWVRDTKVPIREVLTLKALKGQQYVVTWGVSLDFVPHVQGTKLRWHRTSASVHEDLGIDPMDFPDRGRASRLLFSRSNTASLSADVQRVSVAAIDESGAWFERVRDIRSLIPLYREAEAATTCRFGFDNYTQYRLGYAFALAAVGQGEESRRQLDTWLNLHGARLTGSVKELLQFRLNDVSPQ